MIKNIIIILGLFGLLVFGLFSTTNFKKSIVVAQNNISKKPILIKPNQYTDRYCNMNIKDLRYSAQAILHNNDTFFFDDPGCMISWLKEQSNSEDIILWVWARDIDKYINAKDAWYTMTENTPMKYGFGAYSMQKDNMIDFNTLQLKIYRGETMQNHRIQKGIKSLK